MEPLTFFHQSNSWCQITEISRTNFIFSLIFVHSAVTRVRKGGSSATRVIENGAFQILGCDPGQDFGTRVDPGRPEIDLNLTRFCSYFSY